MWRPVLILSTNLLLLVTAQAPGDGDELCTVTLPSICQNVPDYPTNVKPLMDSNHYDFLLPPSAGPVWQAVDNDDNNNIPGLNRNVRNVTL